MRMRCLATMVRPRRAGPGPLRSAPLRSLRRVSTARRRPPEAVTPGAARRQPVPPAGSASGAAGGSGLSASRDRRRLSRRATWCSQERPRRRSPGSRSAAKMAPPAPLLAGGCRAGPGALRTAPRSVLPPAGLESRLRCRRSGRVLPACCGRRCGGGCGGRARRPAVSERGFGRRPGVTSFSRRHRGPWAAFRCALPAAAVAALRGTPGRISAALRGSNARLRRRGAVRCAVRAGPGSVGRAGTAAAPHSVQAQRSCSAGRPAGRSVVTLVHGDRALSGLRLKRGKWRRSVRRTAVVGDGAPRGLPGRLRPPSLQSPGLPPPRSPRPCPRAPLALAAPCRLQRAGLLPGRAAVLLGRAGGHRSERGGGGMGSGPPRCRHCADGVLRVTHRSAPALVLLLAWMRPGVSACQGQNVPYKL